MRQTATRANSVRQSRHRISCVLNSDKVDQGRTGFTGSRLQCLNWVYAFVHFLCNTYLHNIQASKFVYNQQEQVQPGVITLSSWKEGIGATRSSAPNMAGTRDWDAEYVQVEALLVRPGNQALVFVVLQAPGPGQQR